MPDVIGSTACRRVSAMIVTAFVGIGIAAAADSPQILGGAQQVPPVETRASARSAIVVARNGLVTGEIETQGIEGTAAHIHLALTGSNGPVLVTLTKTRPETWSVPPYTMFTPDQYASYRAGQMYVSVDSTAHSGGEIRIQLTPAVAAPP